MGERHAIRRDLIKFGSPSIELTEFGVPQGTEAIVFGSLDSLCWTNELASATSSTRGRSRASFCDASQREILISDFLTQGAPWVQTIRLRYRSQNTTDNGSPYLLCLGRLFFVFGLLSDNVAACKFLF